MANRVFKFLIIGLLSSALAQAQGPGPLPRHPGDVIKYEIKFDGPNADKIKTVTASLSSMEGVPKDQAGFTNGFGTAHPFPPSSPATFIIEMTVPDNIADGNYVLNVGATAQEGSANYANGPDFKLPPIRIENSKKFTPPGIKVTPLL